MRERGRPRKRRMDQEQSAEADATENVMGIASSSGALRAKRPRVRPATASCLSPSPSPEHQATEPMSYGAISSPLLTPVKHRERPGEPQGHKIIAQVREKDIPHHIQSKNEVRLPCELGDVWAHKYTVTRHHDNKVTTGDSFTDGILISLHTQGYNIQSRIAKGEFGSVLLAYSSFHQSLVAMKFIIKSVKRRPRKSHSGSGYPWSADVPDEIQIHKELNHPNIVDYLEYHNINGRLCMVMEFCTGGNMKDLLSARSSGLLPEPVSRRYFWDMVAAVEYLHSQCITHRDIKLENLLVDNHNRIKLCDFGSARRWVMGDEPFNDQPGEIIYQAPEIFQHDSYFPRQADIWSLGIALYMMLTGRKAFGHSFNKMFQRMQAGPKFPEAQILQLTQEVKALIEGMLAFLPQRRLTIAMVRNSAWFQEHCKMVYIGNFYLVSQPQKCKVGKVEQTLKSELEI